MVICVISCWFFFQRFRVIPQLIIAYLFMNLILSGGDFFLTEMIPALGPEAARDATKDLGKAVIGAAIWIPYGLRSQRAKATFVRRPPRAVADSAPSRQTSPSGPRF